MAERTAPARHPAEQGLISSVLGKVSQLLVLLALSLLFSICAEWIGMAFFWPEQGRQHSEAMLAAELGYLSNDFTRSAIVEQPAEFARNTADVFHEYLYRRSGVEAGLLWLAKPPTQPARFRREFASLHQRIADYLFAAMTITQVFAVRLAVLILALPAFVIFGLVAFTDGLAHRDLRRWGGGRESSFVYHWAKRMITPAFVAPWIIYLSVPFSVHPNWVVLPFAILFALAVAVVTGTFKKYL